MKQQKKNCSRDKQKKLLAESKIRPGRNRLFFILTIIFLFFANCKKEVDYYRFIDHLKEKNIISSPLKSLDQEFRRVEQQWTSKEMFQLNSGKLRTWAIPSKSLILGWDDKFNPKGMEVYKNNEKIHFLTNKKPSSSGYKWKRIEEIIEPEKFRGYKRLKGEIILLKEEYFTSQEIILPHGRVIFEITARSKNGMKYVPLLNLFLNNELIGKIPISNYNNYRFIHNVKYGKYRLKIGFQKVLTRSSYREEEALLLDYIRIKSSSDLILISTTDRNKKDYQKGSYKASYYSQPESAVLYPSDFMPAFPETSAIILKTDEGLTKNTTLDRGRNIFEIIAFTTSTNAFLKARLDKKIIGQQRITPWQWKSYFFSTDVEGGKYNLNIEWHNNNDTKDFSTNNQLLIHRVLISGPLINTFLPLHLIKSKYPIFDMGINKNPLFIKKKLEIGEQTLNVIFAPTRSEFEFQLKIPESGILQFGCGKLNQNWDSKNSAVSFKINLEHSKRKETLFSKYLADSSKIKPSEIFEKKISLSDYQGKKVKISFITESSESEEKSQNKNLTRRSEPSFWVNPVIYKKADGESRIRKDEPNIILISVDTLRADHLGCYGYSRDTSPTIDQLAKEGVLFVNTYSHSPTTLPSHMSMLTSLYPTNHGVYTVSLGRSLREGQKLDPSIVTLPDLLRSKNYFTTAITGGGQVSSYYGFSKGFDCYQENKGNLLEDTAESLFEKTAHWINNNRDKKFFLFLHTYQVHTPYVPPSPYDRMYLNKKAKWKEGYLIEILEERQGKYSKLTNDEKENLISLYDGEIRYADEYFIKPLIAELKKLNLYDQTMIIITSDHGEEFYEHKGWEHGHSLYNELIRVPLIIKFPHDKFKGKTVESVARIIDIVPTILGETNIGYRDNNFDGNSLLDLLKGEEKSSRTSTGYYFFANITDEPGVISYILLKTCIIKNNYKLIINENYPNPKKQPTYLFANISPPPYLLEKMELYNIKNDSLEKKNLANQDEKKMQELKELINQYYQSAKEISRIKRIEKPMHDKKMEERLRALGYIR